MAQVINQSVGQKMKLGDVKPGNTVQLEWDGRIGTYIVCKIPMANEFDRNTKVTLVNVETGRLVEKSPSLMCVKVSTTITIKPMG